MSKKTTGGLPPAAHGKTSVTATLGDVSQSLRRLSELALATAVKGGAQGAKISTGASLHKRLVVEGKEFTLANSLESRSLSLVVHKDQKKGSASINTMTEEGVKGAVAAALALAQYSVPDPALTLATAAEAPPAKELPFQYDEAMAEIDLDALYPMMREVLARLQRDPRLALDRFEMAVDASWHGLSNSLGVAQSARQTMATWSFFGMGRDGEEVSGFDYEGDFAFAAKGMLDKALAGGDAFVDKVIGLLHPVRCPSYKGPVLLSPRAVQELLTGMILYHAGGRQVMDGKSRWDKAVGQAVLSPLFSLSDHPHDPRYSGATSFDGDGLPTRALTIVENGVLRLHLHDCYSAKRCQTHSTGTAGGPFAMQVAAGKDALADLKRARSQLLLVDRFSGNSDPVKGDFSGVAKSSRLFVDGVDQGAVTETMIAGNFFELATQILAVSRESELVSGHYSAPYILIDGVSVTGG